MVSGLKSGDQILEINGDDVMQGSLVEVSNAIQSAAATLTMVVVGPGPNRVVSGPVRTMAATCRPDVHQHCPALDT